MIAYVAHPVGAPTPDGVHANVARALRWVRWLVDHTTLAVSAPWIPYVLACEGETPEQRQRGLRDDLAMVERHDLVIECSDRISVGMSLERDHACLCGLSIADLTVLGLAEPPAPGTDEHQRALALISAAVTKAKIRQSRGRR